MSIGAALALMLCLVFTSVTAVFAAYQDGSYSVPVSCEGGSGRGGVRGATVTVSGGNITSVVLSMSSTSYDYAYDPLTGAKVYASVQGVSVFYINYAGSAFSFRADTTAMSQPHEIEYWVTLDLSGIPAAPDQGGSQGGGQGGGGGYVPSGPSAEEIAKAELKKKLDAADALIAQIGEVSLDSEDAIEAAREAVAGFTEEERKGLANLSVLEEAEKAYAAILKKIADADELIEKIGDVTLDSGDAIRAAREAVDALSPKEMVRLTKLGVLKDAESTLEDLRIAAEEAAAKAARTRSMLLYGGIALAVIAIVLIIFLRKRKAGKQ